MYRDESETQLERGPVAQLRYTLKHYECYNEPHYERSIHYEFRGLLMPTALGALHKTSLLIHMPNA